MAPSTNLLYLPAGCVLCNQEVANGIYNSTFFPNLLTMLSAFIVLAVIIVILVLVLRRHDRLNHITHPEYRLKAPLLSASVILGIGMGGLIDGTILHQILQWHEMLSNKIPPNDYVGKSINMFWDGIFHLFCIIVIITGLVMMWKLLKRQNINRSGFLFWGGLLGGWGVFNIVEGIIDHHILKLHNVIEVSANPDLANYTFLGVSALMIIISIILHKKA